MPIYILSFKGRLSTFSGLFVDYFWPVGQKIFYFSFNASRLSVMAAKGGILNHLFARVAELADAPGLGPGRHSLWGFKSLRAYQVVR